MGDTRFLVAVEAAVYREGKYLFVRRSRDDADAPGLLTLPAGTVDVGPAGEDIMEETARREVREETGIEVGRPVHYVLSKSFALDSDRQVIDTVFLCLYRSGTAHPDGIETEEVLWLTPEELAARDDAADWLRRSIDLCEAKREELSWP